MTKGYLTVALGEYYVRLAITLYQSYAIHGGTLPFAVVCLPKDKPCLTRYFSHVVVVEDIPSYTVKLNLYEYSPFDKTIFIDADSTLVAPIDNWWEALEQSGYPVTVWGKTVDIAKFGSAHMPLVSETSIQHHQPPYYIDFNGGVYYFEKNARGTAGVRAGESVAQHLCGG